MVCDDGRPLVVACPFAAFIAFCLRKSTLIQLVSSIFRTFGADLFFKPHTLLRSDRTSL